MGFTGCYVLDLYCDNEENHSILSHVRKEFYLQTIGRNFMEALREAREYGWLVNRKKDFCLCDKCRTGKFIDDEPESTLKIDEE